MWGGPPGPRGVPLDPLFGVRFKPLQTRAGRPGGRLRTRGSAPQFMPASLSGKHFLLGLICLTAYAQSPVQRAVDYLAREVPAWPEKNGCFSCHNNGDGARALYAALQHGLRVPEQALAKTTEWLMDPRQWD